MGRAFRFLGAGLCQSCSRPAPSEVGSYLPQGGETLTSEGALRIMQDDTNSYLEAERRVVSGWCGLGGGEERIVKVGAR